MYAAKQIREKMIIYQPGDRREDRSAGAFYIRVGLTLLSAFGLCFCLTSLYLAMRGVMRLGGMVATGGPYAIAHPAPGWVWIFPVSITAGLIFVGLYFIFSRGVGGLNILPLAWPALFLSLGWNFLEFAFTPGEGHGPVWGWLVCGVVFVLMGGLPLIFIAWHALGLLSRKGRMVPSYVETGHPDEGRTLLGAGKTGRVVIVVWQLTAIGLGIFAAIRFFQGLS